jgi:predicted transcriptional regulator
MSGTKELKKQVKKYIDEADEHTLKIVHAMLEANEEDWYHSLGNEQKKSLQKSIKQADNGELIPHEEVKKMIAKWVTK